MGSVAGASEASTMGFRPTCAGASSSYKTMMDAALPTEQSHERALPGSPGRASSPEGPRSASAGAERTAEFAALLDEIDRSFVTQRDILSQLGDLERDAGVALVLQRGAAVRCPIARPSAGPCSLTLSARSDTTVAASLVD